MEISLQKQLACARRELALRTRVYPRWVATEKMTEDAARRELDGMAAIVQTLERLCTREEEIPPGLVVEVRSVLAGGDPH